MPDTPAPIFAVHYTYAEATVPGRDQHRPAHRDWLRSLVGEGVVLSSGAYPDGSGALILVTAADVGAAERLMTADPFLRNNLVENVRVVEWKPVMGVFAD
ncbi:MAG: hypothetical protein HOQ24_05690 [Mycobacteriaceae bacterium]|nr:hypothetical protein [Mycobacteriaceae bacterium]